MKKVDSSQKKRIIEVSVERLYNTTLKGAGEFGVSRNPYESNTQHYAEEKFMNSLRSETERESTNRGSKSQTRLVPGIQTKEYGASLYSPYKPKLIPVKHGLAERPKKKFVKKIENISYTKSSTQINLKTEDSSKEFINTSHFNHSRSITREKPKESLPKVHLIIKSTTTSTKILTPDKYNLQNLSPSPLKGTKISKKWTFEENKSSQTPDKKKKGSSKIGIPATNSRPMSRSTSKVSEISQTQVSNGKKRIKTDSKEAKIVISNKSNKSLTPKKETKPASSKKKPSAEKSQTVLSSNSSKKIAVSHISESPKEEPKKKSPAKSPAKDKKKSVSGVQNFGVESENTKFDNIDLQFKAIKTLTPVKPSNIMPEATCPESLSDSFVPLVTIPVFEPEESQPNDKPARCESSIGSRKPSAEEAPEENAEDNPQEPEETDVKDVIVPGDEEDFEFDDEDNDINEIVDPVEKVPEEPTVD
jgi:hypothetical protein